MSATVGELISVGAGFIANFTGDVKLEIGTEKLTSAVDWLLALPKVANCTDCDPACFGNDDCDPVCSGDTLSTAADCAECENCEGYIPNFFQATASFSGDITADVVASEPFQDIQLPSVTGTLKEFVLDLGADLDEAKKKLPDFDFDINLPNFGGVKNLGFKDIIKVLDRALDFLIGQGSVEDCSDGLLGTELGGEKLFLKPLPSKFPSSSCHVLCDA